MDICLECREIARVLEAVLISNHQIPWAVCEPRIFNKQNYIICLVSDCSKKKSRAFYYFSLRINKQIKHILS